MDRQQIRLSALRCGNRNRTPEWLPLCSALSAPCSSFPNSFSPSPSPTSLCLVWKLLSLSFGIWHSAQTHRPLCCFLLYMSPSDPDLLLPGNPSAPPHQHLRNCWQKALTTVEEMCTLLSTFPARQPSFQTVRGACRYCFRQRGEGLELLPCVLINYFYMFKLLVKAGSIMLP